MTAELPRHLHERFRDLASDVRNQYRWAISLTWGMVVLATTLIVAAVQLFRKWIARPLETLAQAPARWPPENSTTACSWILTTKCASWPKR